MSRRWLQPTLVTWLCLAGAHGCGRPDQTAPRWIEQEPQERLLPEALYRYEDAARWQLGREADRAHWLPTDPGRVAVDGTGALAVRADGSEPLLMLSRSLDAGDVDALEVVTAGAQTGQMVLAWAGPGEAFDIDRRIVLETGEALADGDQSWRFDLRSHPAWRGPVTHLELRPTTAAETVRVRQIALARRTLVPGALTQAAALPWRIELGQELRNARIARPELTWTPQREGGTLVFGYGIQPGVATPVRFEVALADETGVRPVWHDTLDPSRGDTDRWHDVRIALPEFRHDTEIRFRTTGADADPRLGLALWADPRLVGASARAERLNLVLISIDTLRADALSSYGNPRPTSPRIDGWAAKSATLFERVVAAAPWTLPAHATLFTGLDAITHGTNHFGSMSNRLETVAERLRANGWTTGAVTGGGYLRPGFGLDQGFDSFAYWRHLETDGELAHGLERSIDWLTRHAGEPFFLFFHTYEVHYPHRRRQPWFDQLASARVAALRDVAVRLQPRGWEGLLFAGDRLEVRRPGQSDWSADLTEGERELVRTEYESAVGMADDAVGRLLDHLAALEVADRTVVVVTSDHGEALGEGGRVGHTFLEDENALVPLMIALPDGTGAGQRIRGPVHQADVMPTVLDALGLAPPSDIDGRSLLADLRGVPPERFAPAWTYAAAANRGLAERTGENSFQVVQLSPWRELHAETSPSGAAAVAASSDDAAPPRALRQSTRKYVADHHRGLRLELRNASQGRLVGELKGIWADHARVKTLDPECRCLSWNPQTGPAFELAPGQRTVLLFESLPTGSVGIRWQVRDDPALPSDWEELSLEPDRIAEPLTRTAAAAGWQASPDGWPEHATGLRVWWPRPEARPEPAPAATDADTRAQLRALGYLE